MPGVYSERHGILARNRWESVPKGRRMWRVGKTAEKRKNPQSLTGQRVSESRRCDLNTRPTLYESVALPAELRRREGRTSVRGDFPAVLRTMPVLTPGDRGMSCIARQIIAHPQGGASRNLRRGACEPLPRPVRPVRLIRSDAPFPCRAVGHHRVRKRLRRPGGDASGTAACARRHPRDSRAPAGGATRSAVCRPKPFRGYGTVRGRAVTSTSTSRRKAAASSGGTGLM